MRARVTPGSSIIVQAAPGTGLTYASRVRAILGGYVSGTLFVGSHQVTREVQTFSHGFV